MSEVLKAIERLRPFVEQFSEPDGIKACDMLDPQRMHDCLEIARIYFREHPVDEVQQYEEKNWGRVQHRFYDEHVGESLLEVVAGQRCSMHYHEHRVNVFICLTAEIDVELYGAVPDDFDGNPFDRRKVDYKLLPGMSTMIHPMFWHLFKVRKPGQVVEIYYCPDGSHVRQDDIVRFDVGCSTEQ